MLFSKMVAFLQKTRKKAMDMTAAGMDAEIVVPIFRPK
jgi:hypothetical protein